MIIETKLDFNDILEFLDWLEENCSYYELLKPNGNNGFITETDAQYIFYYEHFPPDKSLDIFTFIPRKNEAVAFKLRWA